LRCDSQWHWGIDILTQTPFRPISQTGHRPIARGAGTAFYDPQEADLLCGVQGKGQAEPETVFDDHFVAVVDAELRRFDDICAALFEFGE